MKQALLIFLTFVCCAGAATAEAEDHKGPPPTPVGTLGCSNYPAAVSAAGVGGTTELAFTIGVDGVPHGSRVVASSGNSDLDRAAISCVETWRYAPRNTNDGPMDWGTKIVWVPPPMPPRPIGEPHQCTDHPTLVGIDRPQAPTVVGYHVGVDGSTHDLIVQKSSGLTEFDAAALECVAAWKYLPAISDGHPVDREMSIAMNWGLPSEHDYTTKTTLAIDLADLTPMVHRLGLDTHLELTLSRVLKYAAGTKGWRCRQMFLEVKDEHRTQHWFAQDFDDGPDLMYARIIDHHYIAVHIRADGTFVAALNIDDDRKGGGYLLAYDDVKGFLDEEVRYWNRSGQTGR